MEIPPRDYLMGRSEAWKSGSRMILVGSIGAIAGLLISYYSLLITGFEFDTAGIPATIFVIVIFLPFSVSAGIIASHFLFYQIETHFSQTD